MELLLHRPTACCRERPWVTQGRRAGRGEQLVERQPPDPSGVPRVPTAGAAPRQPHLEHGPRACQPPRRRAEEPYLAVCAAEKGAQDLPARFLAATARDLRQGAAFEIA